MREIINTWPETISVFMAFKMNCIGCYMSSFDTLEDAITVHSIPIDEILAELNKIIGKSTTMETENE